MTLFVGTARGDIFTAADSSDVLFGLEGYDLIGEQVRTVGSGTSTTYDLDDAIFYVVTKVQFTASGGTDVPGDAGIGTHFAQDDLVFIG